MFKRGLLIIGFAALVGGAPLSAQAMPVDRGVAVDGSMVDTVAMGCGPGWTRNPWGRCVPFRRFGPRIIVRRPFYGPRFYHGPRRFYGRPYRRW